MKLIRVALKLTWGGPMKLMGGSEIDGGGAMKLIRGVYEVDIGCLWNCCRGGGYEIEGGATKLIGGLLKLIGGDYKVEGGPTGTYGDTPQHYIA